MQTLREESGAPVRGLGHIAVLLPAREPDVRLLELVAALRRLPFAAVLVVDDGSSLRSQSIFESLRAAGVPVLRHAVNQGKGSALKSGFEALLSGYPTMRGVVTADADGQHQPEDIVRVAEALAAHAERPVLGSRAFTGPMPLRCRLGNMLTRVLFRLITGVRLRDNGMSTR